MPESKITPEPNIRAPLRRRKKKSIFYYFRLKNTRRRKNGTWYDWILYWAYSYCIFITGYLCWFDLITQDWKGAVLLVITTVVLCYMRSSLSI